MNKELFGVFGDAARFQRLRSADEFDRLVEGASVTVGLKDPALSIPHRTSTDASGDGLCVVWGETYLRGDAEGDAASWFSRRYGRRGTDALLGLNGSYLVVVELDGRPVVYTDPLRTRECFYADTPVGRVFGTDPIAVAQTIPSPTIQETALLELLHLSVVTGERTVIEELRRVPFDGYLDEASSGELERFVYEPREFDYVEELANRLQRALSRRSSLPGRKGLLLSGGYDSRTILAGIDDLDRTYTIGPQGGEVVRASQRVSAQYGVPHRELPIDDRYLHPFPETIQYGQGIKESIHVHHAGYTADLDVDTIYHALLFDSLLRGHFLPRDDIELFGHTMPRTSLDDDPAPVDTILDRFAFIDERGDVLPGVESVETDDVRSFIRSVIEERLAQQSDRVDSVYNAIELFGLVNQPSTPFQTHLADTFLESFIAADVELLDWHLTTPPEHRHTGTFIEAIERLDGDILRHPPHDRPHHSQMANEVEGFLRRKLPLVEPFDPAWPDPSAIYDRRDLDTRLFGPEAEVGDLPLRMKLRINDVTNWLEMAVDETVASPPALRPRSVDTPDPGVGDRFVAAATSLTK